MWGLLGSAPRLMIRKVYRLFGIPVWSVTVETYEVDDDEEDDSGGGYSPVLDRAIGEPPMFGFTNWKEYTGD